MEQVNFWQIVAALGPWTAAIGGLLYLLVKLTVRNAILEGFAKLNGTYVRSEGANVTGAEIERRLEAIEHRPANAAFFPPV